MTIYRFEAALLMSLLVTACSNEQQFGQDDRICTIPGPAATNAARNLAEQMIITDRCVHAWSYRLARAPGPTREIAQAVLGGCREALLYEADFMLKMEDVRPTYATEQAALDRLRQRYSEKALFHVAQARAGNCRIP